MKTSLYFHAAGSGQKKTYGATVFTTARTARRVGVCLAIESLVVFSSMTTAEARALGKQLVSQADAADADTRFRKPLPSPYPAGSKQDFVFRQLQVLPAQRQRITRQLARKGLRKSDVKHLQCARRTIRRCELFMKSVAVNLGLQPSPAP